MLPTKLKRKPTAPRIKATVIQLFAEDERFESFKLSDDINFSPRGKPLA